MKTNFKLVALGPFVSAVVALATAAALMRGSWSNPARRPGASTWAIC